MSEQAKIQLALLLLLSAAACAGTATTPAPTPQPPRAPTTGPTPTTATALPPIPPRVGALNVDVVYPSEGSTLGSADSTFVFGNTGTGAASLTINNANLSVAPNGAFLAFLPIPRDGVYHVSATTPSGETASFDRRVKLPAPTVASASPRGSWVAIRGERIEVSVRGTPGARAWIVMPDGTRSLLVETRGEYRGSFAARPLISADTSVGMPTLVNPVAQRDSITEVKSGVLAPRDTVLRTRRTQPKRVSVPAPPRQRGALILMVNGIDTTRTPLPLNLGVLEPDQPRVGVAIEANPSDPDKRGYVVGRPGTSGPFQYLWPYGTELTITGERGNLYRVRLDTDLSVWVNRSEVRLSTEGTAEPSARISNVTFNPGIVSVDARISTGGRRLPFYVTQTNRTLQLDVFGGTSYINTMHYGPLDPLIARATWSQPRSDVFRLTVDLAKPVWGYQVNFAENGDMIFRVRRPPTIDPNRPLAGVTIVVDPGHPPEGAIGPTRLTEADANLAIALKIRPLLEAAGARVMMTRTDGSSVPLNWRPLFATQQNAQILFSVHNNAFPDGVNPFENNGTSVYYYQPQSIDLAMSFQAELLQEFGLRNLGIARGDLALVRPTWMPSALTETMFLMIPQQEAALRNPEVQERIARAHVRALERFLRERARN